MKASVFFDILNLKFDRKLDVNINEGLFHLTNIDSKRADVYTEIYRKALGLNETAYVPESVFAVSDITLPDMDLKLYEEIKAQFEPILFDRLQFVEALLFFLWFVKDNSISLYGTVGQIPAINLAHRITQSFSTYCADGTKRNITFSDSEVKMAADLTIQFEQSKPRKPVKTTLEMLATDFELDNTGKPFRAFLNRYGNNFNYNDQDCIGRAFQFLITARSQSVLLFKIAYYMPIFECLFTHEGGEISSKIGYRVAFYVGQSLDECADIFSTITEGYNIRSRFLHGQPFSKDNQIEQGKLSRLSQKIDNILREVFLKAITTDREIFMNWPAEDRSKYFSSLVFEQPFERKITAGKKTK